MSRITEGSSISYKHNIFSAYTLGSEGEVARKKNIKIRGKNYRSMIYNNLWLEHYRSLSNEQILSLFTKIIYRINM